MEAFQEIDGRMFCDEVPLEAIAERFGTPTYVYSRRAIESAYREFHAAAAGHDALVCYALKANSNLAVIDCLARLGAGFDIVSGGELARVMAAGADPGRVVFSGVGKSEAEMRAALEAGVMCFNVESVPELERLQQVAARADALAPVSIRVNPDVDARTHPYISTGLRENKFGISHEIALEVYDRAALMPNLDLVGIDCHIGSQITQVDPFLAALDKMLELVDAIEASGIVLHHIDLGGGLGIRYDEESPPARGALLRAIFDHIERWRGERRYRILFEFGRSIVGNAGALLTRVEYLKINGGRRFAVVDAAMNDLLRPTLYDAYHAIRPVRPRAEPAHRYDVVGPVCESGDWLGRERMLAIEPGDLLAVMSSGAYGMAMASNYNTRPRGAEVMVDGDQVYPIRARESVESLFAGESRLP